MTTPGTIDDLFDKAIALERSAEQFYRRLAEIFASDEEVAKFWSKVADEERGHASFLDLMRGKLSPAVLSSLGNPGILEKAQRLLSTSVDDTLGRVKTLNDAYRIAVELEHSETNAIFNFILVNFPPPEFSKARAFLNVQLEKHVAAIEEGFLVKFQSRLGR